MSDWLLLSDQINLKTCVVFYFPSKPWATSVHLVRVGLVTIRTGEGEDIKKKKKKRRRRRRREAVWLIVDFGMWEEVLVSGWFKL